MRSLIAMGLVCWSAVAAAAPPEYKLEIGGDLKPISIAPLTETMKDPEGLTLVVTCSGTTDCTKLFPSAEPRDDGKSVINTLSLRGKPDATKEHAVFRVPANVKFHLTYHDGQNNNRLYNLALDDGTPREPNGPTAKDVTPIGGTVSALARVQCDASGSTPAANEVFATPLGSLLSAPPPHFSESQSLVVTVVGEPRLLDTLQVRRKSAIRSVSVRVLGDDQAREAVLDTQAEKSPEPPKCAAKSFVVSDFDSGTGEVEIRAQTASGVTALGTFQILVDPTYLGMFSIGAGWTPILDTSFGVAMRDGTQVIVQKEQGSRRLSYLFLFTPFLWDGLDRDVRVPMTARNFYKHFNPSVGFLVNDPLNNALLGVTFDFQSCVLVTGGGLFSHVQELDGVKVGDVFAGAASELPTHKRWKVDWFVGVSVDLRVGVKLLRAVLGTASGDGS